MISVFDSAVWFVSVSLYLYPLEEILQKDILVTIDARFTYVSRVPVSLLGAPDKRWNSYIV